MARRRKDVKAKGIKLLQFMRLLQLEGLVAIEHIITNTTLHLAIEINQTLIEGLVDTRASMLVMVANIVKELGIMHLVVGNET